MSDVRKKRLKERSHKKDERERKNMKKRSLV